MRQLPRLASLCAGLAAAWLAWSGHLEPGMLGFGALSVALVAFVSLRAGVFEEPSGPRWIGLRLLGYVPWLLWQILLANLHVARVILSPGPPVKPRLMRVTASQTSDLGRAIHACSITLTPGTVSLDIRDGRILVHALTAEAAAGLEEGAIDRRVTRLEGPTG